MYADLGYSDGVAHAADDIEYLGIVRAREVAKTLTGNRMFTESYTAGYQTRIGKEK